MEKDMDYCCLGLGLLGRDVGMEKNIMKTIIVCRV